MSPSHRSVRMFTRHICLVLSVVESVSMVKVQTGSFVNFEAHQTRPI